MCLLREPRFQRETIIVTYDIWYLVHLTKTYPLDVCWDCFTFAWSQHDLCSWCHYMSCVLYGGAVTQNRVLPSERTGNQYTLTCSNSAKKGPIAGQPKPVYDTKSL